MPSKVRRLHELVIVSEMQEIINSKVGGSHDLVVVVSEMKEMVNA